MSNTSSGYKGLPRSSPLPDVIDFANRLMIGRLNATFPVTLTTGTQTTLSDSRLGPFSYVSPMALTATAKTAQVAGFYYTTQSKHSLVINHAANSASDQTFRFLIIG